MPPHRILITPGEPAGIGPDLTVQLAQQARPYELTAVCDPALLASRAEELGLRLAIRELEGTAPPRPTAAGEIAVVPVPAAERVETGRLNTANAHYVLATLTRAVALCRAGRADALVTGPVHKGVVNDAGIAFTGHTEFLADLTGTPQVVMMLATPGLRVALATTHLPLREVPDAISRPLLMQVTTVLHDDLRARFGIPHPRILVCGLNPHAGEGGHLGREEIDVIGPALDRLRDEGLFVEGPIPADTAFLPARLAACDVVLAMYHDQGLPVLKARGFGHAVNVTLGLPLIRTSVDHGTALDLAGTGRAEIGSFEYAIEVALEQVRCSAGK